MCDSEHIVIQSVKFTDGAKLHRFVNPGEVLYSAIYKDGVEVMSSERMYEQRMIATYQATIADGTV